MFGQARVPFLQRYRTSRAIFQQSMALLGKERDLWLLPVLGGLLLLVATAVLVALPTVAFGPAWFDGIDPVFLPLVVLPLMFPVMATAAFFQSALAFCLHERLAGRPARRRDGLRRAWAQLGPIVRFSLVAMLVSGVLQVVGQLLGKLRLVPYLGNVVSSLGAFAWAAATFFVIPVLVVEQERHALGAIRSSTAIARSQWGKATAGMVTIGLALLVPMLLLTLLFFGFTMAAFPLGIGTAGFILVAATFVVTMMGIATASQAATTAYQVGLYRFARTGHVSGPFTAATLADAWAPYRQP
jgi:hypothetical protein